MGGMHISGVIVKGLGEGSYFMSMEHYKKEIKKKLGYNAYPGTLNIRINNKQSNLFKKLKSTKISGYKKNNKVYGGASCYKATINSIKGSIIVPDINKHKKNIIEFISYVHIKSKLNIKNGDEIKIDLTK